MNYWVISDTHFGHEKMYEFCGRPHGFETVLLNNIRKLVSCTDVLIHLGDVCFGNDLEWHNKLCSIPVTRWLVRGNHDSKSVAWYVSHGWQSVSDSFTLDMFGREILFSHMPKADTGYGLNIHGHFHNSDHRRHEPELVAVKNDRQFLVAVEYEKYQPVNLKSIVRRAEKS